MLYTHYTRRYEESHAAASATGVSFSVHDTDPRLEGGGDAGGDPKPDELSDDKVFGWLQERSQGKIKSPEDFQALLATAQGLDEESKSSLELGKQVRSNPFVSEIVNYALQPGGQDRVDQYIGILRQTQKAGEMTDFDAIALADHLKTGFDLEKTKLALKERYMVDELSENSLSDSQKAKAEYELSLAAKTAREELGVFAERSKITPENRDVETTREAQAVANQKRIESYKPLIDGVATKVSAINHTVTVPFSDGSKVDIPLQFDIASTPERVQEFRGIVQNIAENIPNAYSPEFEPQLLAAAQEVYIGKHWRTMLTAFATNIAGNADLAAAKRFHEPARGRAPMTSSPEKVVAPGVVQGKDSKGNTWYVSDHPFDDE